MIECLEIFKGDDSDFSLNQRISVKLLSELDLTGMVAEVQVYDYIQTYNPIPANRRLPLVFPASVTRKFPLGRVAAKIRLFDQQGRRRTVENQLMILVTNSVDCLSKQDVTYSLVLEISYNDLNDKPALGGVTIEGDRDLHYYGIAKISDIPEVIESYKDLQDKPAIDGVVLEGDKDAHAFGLAKLTDIPEAASSYAELKDKPALGGVVIEGDKDPHYYGLAKITDIPELEAPFTVKKGNKVYQVDIYDTPDEGIGFDITDVTPVE